MEKEKLVSLVTRSQSRDQAAIEELLRFAHTWVSYQCRKMLKNAQDAEDVTQEVLLAVYTNLDTLQEPAAFGGWLNRITATRCFNAMKRTHVDLQIAEDEEGHSLLDSIEELDQQKIPEEALDNAETTRMIEELVDALPEAQRMCVLMYYYDELSVKEIAQMTATSENTVKSRLNYARKAIKEGVLDYEKKGIKLYSLSPLPFLLFFLRKAAENSADPAAAQAAAEKVLASAAAITAAVGAGNAGDPGAGSGSAGVRADAGGGGTAAGGSAGTAGAGAATGSTAGAGGAAGGHLLGGLAVKVIAGVLAGVVALGAAGVGVYAATGHCLAHEWVEATCTAPKTCSKCGKTEGEPLPHTWVEATCTEPKTCAVCGKTEGEPLPHTWIEATCTEPKTCQVCGTTEGEPLGHTMLPANFQQPATCAVCGFTEGEPLVPQFVSGGRECNAVLDTEYDYTVPTYQKPSVTTTATAVFSNYQIFPSSDTLPGKEGYEWRTVEMDVTFHDENAWYYGFNWGWIATDYYGEDPNVPESDEYPYTQDEAFAENVQHFVVFYNGELMTDCMDFTTEDSSGWQSDKTYTIHFVHKVFVPVGYDGCVFGIYDGYQNEWTDEMTFLDVEPKSMILFRMA